MRGSPLLLLSSSETPSRHATRDEDFLDMSIPVADALKAIQHEGFFVFENEKVGKRVLQFDQEVKSPAGFKFLARNSLDNPEILDITRSLLSRPWWAFVRLYSDILPSDYAFAFHAGPQRVALAIQLWGPGSTLAFPQGSHLHGITKENIDERLSNEWGLLAARLDMPETQLTLQEGGVVMADSRQCVRIITGQCITIGYASENMLGHIGKMELPYSQEFEETLEQLKSQGFDIRYKWKEDKDPQPV
ncbi:hypothetical protein FSARC_7464 [Fusarium sarcochroum]|uniref:Uncharacterized protein n=1 Tax=Fusarium sarcochroum TaxID=1208366 RepID=A0A8H4X7A4_9HYPO|nr:hypothetical protein FSARC_7464 [Fusarium sarcochroum]